MAKARLTRVTFTELHEVAGAFGQEWVSPGGGGFPKHLIHSYDLKTKTVVFPTGWKIKQDTIPAIEGGEFFHPIYSFVFGDFCNTVILYGYIEKADSVEIDYDPKDFQPDHKLVVVTLRVPRRNKVRTDKLIKKYQTSKTVVAERSRKSSMVIDGGGRKKRTFPQYLYELVLRKSEWKDFAKQVYKQNLVPKTQRFAILAEGPVFPRQLAYFKDSN
ncbi:MAG: hypothetical protein Q8R55_01165 [Candidatus Taylorbacteria bacterium]|nr:hypothetical protein [Candidatus Taylorbacteria bacterium]